MIVNRISEMINSDGKPEWWKYIINQAIQLGQLSNSEFEQAYQLAKMEHGLAVKIADYERLIKKVQAIGYSEELEENRILSLSNAQNISKLAKNQTIDFSTTGINIVYGNNGAGKSSYSKVLKNACLTRGDTPNLSHNIFSEKLGNPSLDIQIESNNKIELISWDSQCEPDTRLKSIRVFDSSSSIHYLSKSDQLNFKPPALKLLDELLQACNFIQQKVKLDESVYLEKLTLPEMGKETSVSKLVITSKTKVEDIYNLCATKEELEELELLKSDVIELTNSSPEKLREKYKNNRLDILPLHNFLKNLISNFNLESKKNYKSFYDKKQKAQLTAVELSRSTFFELPITQIGTDSWITMLNAVKKFIENSEEYLQFPPKEGDYCPTCLNSLDSLSISRLSSFNIYLNSEVQKEAEHAESKWKSEIDKINKLNFSLEPYSAILEKIRNKNNDFYESILLLIHKLKEEKNKLLMDIPLIEINELDTDVLKRLDVYITALEEREKSVKDDDTKNSAIILKKKRINEIEDRNKILIFKNQIIDEIDRCKKIEAFKNIKNSTNTVAITKLITDICNSDSIGQIQEFFEKELTKLGFNHFKVKTLTKGVRGSQNLSLGLEESKVNILEIASEGEQKCISLACFFAELSTDNRKSAIIFDDPVNSLDHIWRLKFAERICEEAKTRQVIIFTHDLPFLKLIQEVSEKIHVEVHIKALSRNNQNTGISQNTAPWDALNTDKRIKNLKELAVRAKKLSLESDTEYQIFAGFIYGRKREAWERLIEEWLIKGTVERFSRGIQTQKIRYLTDIVQEDVDLINAAMGKCSTYMAGHDMSEEITGIFPSITELEEDIEKLESYFTSLKRRRK